MLFVIEHALHPLRVTLFGMKGLFGSVGQSYSEIYREVILNDQLYFPVSAGKLQHPARILGWQLAHLI